MPERILVVEDEPALQEALVYNLRQLSYEVTAVGNGREALDTVRQFKPDLIILDVMLPGLDGIELARLIRKEMNPAILMVTARGGEIDRVVGLEVGADDYVVKPFSMRELMARVRAMLRRTEQIREDLARASADTPHRTLSLRDLQLDVTRREVTLDGRTLPLRPKEYDLLLFLAENKGRMLTREFILERVWGWSFVGDSRTVDVHIRWLRQKIERDAANPERIVTVRGGGYRFEG